MDQPQFFALNRDNDLHSQLPGPSGHNKVERVSENCKSGIDITITAPSEVDEDSELSPNNFVRSYRDSGVGVETILGSPSKLSRLSLAIRRSLRLSIPAGRGAKAAHREVLVQERQPSSFTEFTDLRPEVFVQPKYGTLDNLHRLIGTKHYRGLKHFLRENDWPVTHEIRKELWLVLVSHDDKEFDSSKYFYREQIDTLLRGKAHNFRPAFLSEPGIVVCDHGLREIGVINLQRLLIVIEYAKPEIRFVPILYPLCAIFLHYHTVEETFACISRLLAQGNRFILQSELAVFASRYTLLALLKKFKKKVFNKLRRRVGSDEAKLAEVIASWHFWIFKCLPFPYLVRVVDCFLLEGQKMLARIALTILYLWYKQEGRQATIVRQKGASNRVVLDAKKASTVEDRVAEVGAEICAVAAKVPVSVQTFLDIGFSIRRFSNNSLDHQQRHYENKFRELVSKKRAEKNARQNDERIYTPAFASKIVDEEVARELMGALPPRFQLETPTEMFRLSEHGTSFVQFWSRIEEAEQSLLLIRSTEGHVFGAYLSSSWAERKDIRERAKTRYFGTGESFVWRLDEELKLPVFYTWSEQTCENYFMAANDKFMIIGSGGGDSIAIRDQLVEGSSRPSSTFQSPELVPGGQFQIDEIEVFSIASIN